MQAISNLIDHGMSIQEAVEAPHLWIQGCGVEVEQGVPANVPAQLRSRDHDARKKGILLPLPFDGSASLLPAAAWRPYPALHQRSRACTRTLPSQTQDL